MDKYKLEFIENYFYEHCEDEFIYIVLHSLFNCISDSELQILYFENAKGNPVLKKTIENYIVKRTTNEPKRQFDNIAKTLLNDYINQDYATQRTIRTFVSRFVRTLPKKTIQLFFDLLIFSERKLDRHVANEVADLILSDEVKEQLLTNFYKYQDEYSLLPIINNFESEELCLLIEQFWTSDFPSNRIKSTIIKKISELDIDCFSFLKENDIVFYYQLLNIKKIVVSEVEIKKLLKNVTEENQYYLLWTIGMSGNWKQTTKFIAEIEKMTNS